MFLWLVLLLALSALARPPLAAGQGSAPATDVREQRVTKRVARGDTLPRLLTDLGVSTAVTNRWLRAVARQVGVTNVLKPGDSISFYFIARWGAPGAGHLTALHIQRPGSRPLTWQLRGEQIVYHRDKGLRPLVSVARDVEPAAGSGAPTAPRAAAKTPAKAAAPAAGKSAAATPAVAKVTHVLRRGETLGRVLRAEGVGARPAHPWIRAVGKKYSLKRLYPGRKIILFFVPGAEGGARRTLRALQIESRGGDLLTWQWSAGRIVYRGRNHRVVLEKAAAAPEPAPAKTPAGASARAPAPRSSKPAQPSPPPAAPPPTASSSPAQPPPAALSSPAQPPPTASSKPAQSPPTASPSPTQPPPTAASSPTQPSPTASSKPTQSQPAPASLPPLASPPPIRSFEPLEQVTRTVGRGQTLARILRPLGVTGKEAVAWFKAIDRHYSVTRLRPGQRLRLYFAKTPSRHRRNNLKAVELEVKKDRRLAWERVGDKFRFRDGGLPERGRTPRRMAATPPRDASSPAPEGSFLSEYALARIKRRNGLMEYNPSSNGSANGQRPVPSLEDAKRTTHRLKSGQHLWGVLRRYEKDDNERRVWLAALQRQGRQVRRVPVGSDINFYFKAAADGNGAAESRGAGSLQALEIVIRSNLRLTWYRSEKGIRFYEDEMPYEQEVRSVSGVINEGSLYGSAKRAGVAVAVVSHMVDILAWDINFQKDLRPGDSYRVLYRRKFRPGSARSERIRILAAEFVNRGRKHTAVYFEGADGIGSYYDPRGRSVSRSFLRYPVEFRRISSRFSKRRFHPVLKVPRPHYGVDFAARTGTPIRAVGDGRVTRAGWKGGYGRLVEISHGGAMKTRYAHLRRYGPGIRRGVSVKKGQTIGYVGCSGLCTGPHLHFEIWQNNRHVDPLRAKIPRERKLDPLLMNVFEATKTLFLERLETGPKTAALPMPGPS